MKSPIPSCRWSTSGQIHSGVENATIYGKLLVVNLQAICFPEVVSEMADYLIRLEGIETVLSMGHYNDEVILSIRTTQHAPQCGRDHQEGWWREGERPEGTA